MPRRTHAKREAGSLTTTTRTTGEHAPAADRSGRDVLGRLRATDESIRHQMAVRQRDRAGSVDLTAGPGRR
jgi:hypothetical protein